MELNKIITTKKNKTKQRKYKKRPVLNLRALAWGVMATGGGIKDRLVVTAKTVVGC